jgi:hypothetical protein
VTKTRACFYFINKMMTAQDRYRFFVLSKIYVFFFCYHPHIILYSLSPFSCKTLTTFLCFVANIKKSFRKGTKENIWTWVPSFIHEEETYYWNNSSLRLSKSGWCTLHKKKSRWDVGNFAFFLCHTYKE